MVLVKCIQRINQKKNNLALVGQPLFLQRVLSPLKSHWPPNRHQLTSSPSPDQRQAPSNFCPSIEHPIAAGKLASFLFLRVSLGICLIYNLCYGIIVLITLENPPI